MVTTGAGSIYEVVEAIPRAKDIVVRSLGSDQSTILPRERAVVIGTADAKRIREEHAAAVAQPELTREQSIAVCRGEGHPVEAGAESCVCYVLQHPDEYAPADPSEPVGCYECGTPCDPKVCSQVEEAEGEGGEHYDYGADEDVDTYAPVPVLAQAEGAPRDLDAEDTAAEARDSHVAPTWPAVGDTVTPKGHKNRGKPYVVTAVSSVPHEPVALMVRPAWLPEDEGKAYEMWPSQVEPYEGDSHVTPDVPVKGDVVTGTLCSSRPGQVPRRVTVGPITRDAEIIDGGRVRVFHEGAEPDPSVSVPTLLRDVRVDSHVAPDVPEDPKCAATEAAQGCSFPETPHTCSSQERAARLHARADRLQELADELRRDAESPSPYAGRTTADYASSCIRQAALLDERAAAARTKAGSLAESAPERTSTASALADSRPEPGTDRAHVMAIDPTAKPGPDGAGAAGPSVEPVTDEGDDDGELHSLVFLPDGEVEPGSVVGILLAAASAHDSLQGPGRVVRRQVERDRARRRQSRSRRAKADKR